MSSYDVGLKLAPEVEKSHRRRLERGFYSQFCSGAGVDVGYVGNVEYPTRPVLSNAVGVDLETKGYNGLNLPWESGTLDFVFSSHMLEHVSEPHKFIREWYRVLKVGGHMVIIVPHQFLYEKKLDLPSRWNGEHKAFYTPQSLMRLIEHSLVPNSYRLAFMRDNDDNFDYAIPPDQHSGGCYEIECVIKKIEWPVWKLE